MGDPEKLDFGNASEADARAEWRTLYEGRERRLVMAIAMAEVREHDGDLEEQLMRLRIHNHEVMRLLDDESWDSVVKYLKAGVLVSADPEDAGDAVALAVKLMKAFDDGRRSVWGIRPMVGISVGDVVDLAAPGSGDPQGPAVDQAIRLVYEIATPQQILVETDVVDADDLETGIELEPLEGKAKAMLGAPDPLTISEVVWRGASAPITNRWRLNADVLRIQRATLDVITEMNALQWEQRANIYKSTLNDGDVHSFKRGVRRLERLALPKLFEAWAESDEANDVENLDGYVEDVRTTYTSVIAAFEKYRGTSSEKNDAVSELRDAWSAFDDGVTALSHELQETMQRLRITHV